jgi:hypothetical protein
MEEIDYKIRAPYDGEFIKSFQGTDDKDEIAQFLKDYGFVVFDNLLTEDEIEKSIDDLWEAYPGAKRNDPSTWENVYHKYGFAGQQPLNGLQIWDNRQNANIYEAFRLSYELMSDKPLNEPLVACLDRGNIMPPTRGEYGRPEWRAIRNHHWDLNPYVWSGHFKRGEAENKKFYSKYTSLLSEGNNTPSYGLPKLRGVLQFSESSENTGGLELLSGFHRYVATWCKAHPLTPMDYVSAYGWRVEANNPVATNMQKILVRRGSLIIFTAELPHTMYPNDSDGFRYAQYLRMAPLSTLELTEELMLKRRDLVHEHLPRELDVTAIGKEVFLLE